MDFTAPVCVLNGIQINSSHSVCPVDDLAAVCVSYLFTRV